MDAYLENEARSDPIAADLLVVALNDGDAARLDVLSGPADIQEVPSYCG
jgi:hypothetical protein